MNYEFPPTLQAELGPLIGRKVKVLAGGFTIHGVLNDFLVDPQGQLSKLVLNQATIQDVGAVRGDLVGAAQLRINGPSVVTWLLDE